MSELAVVVEAVSIVALCLKVSSLRDNLASATTAERNRAATVAERHGGATGKWLAREIRKVEPVPEVCTRAAGHDGPCNGYPCATCGERDV